MGDKEIYNPWSILNYVRRKVLVPYWVNTSANTMLNKLYKKQTTTLKNNMKNL